MTKELGVATIMKDAAGVAEPGGMRRLVERVLLRLRHEGRRAIRIVDVDCRTGRRLAAVVHRAQALGFTTVEACGYAPTRAGAIAAARASARHPDLAIGWRFDADDAAHALRMEEAEGDADLILAPCDVAPAGRTHAPVVPIGRTRRVRAALVSRVAAKRATPRPGMVA